MNEEKEIGPEKFFNLEHPGNPYVEIEFRTSKPTNADDPNSANWESITLDNNFFDSLTITDESGFQELELALQDRDYINIEDIILRTIMNSRVEAWSGIASESTNAEQFKKATHSLDNAEPIDKDAPQNSKERIEQLEEQNKNLANSINENNKDNENGKQTQQVIDANNAEIDKLNNTQAKQTRNESVMENSFQVYIDSSMASCIRILFGWASNQKNIYFETEDLDAFRKRTEQTNPVIRSPWLYFMMLGANYNIDSNGQMKFIIKGISVAKAYLERAKFLMNGTVLQGLPQEIWEVLHKSINMANKGNIILEAPNEDFFKSQNKEIKLSSLYENPMIYLDSTGNEKRTLHFKSLRQLISDYINLLQSKYIDYDGAEIPLKDDEVPDSSQVHHVEKPDFIIERDKTTNKSIVKLYYRKPDINKQDFIRVYSWKDAKNSIIKNFSISTDSDFAQMNAPITIKDGEGGFQQINLSSTTADPKGMDLNPNVLRNLTDQIKKSKGQIGFISAEVFKSGNYNGTKDFIASFVQNLNDNVFKGTIDLLLDPFYLFDNALKPYEYLIKIDVNTPSRYTRQGIYVEGSKSYLTGYYMIGKIQHSITSSSATTTLEVIKFPEVRPNAGRNVNLSEKQDRAQKLASIKNIDAKVQAKQAEIDRTATDISNKKKEINNTRTHLEDLKNKKADAWQIQKYEKTLAQQNKDLSDLEFSLDFSKDQLEGIISEAEAMKAYYKGN